MSSKTLSKIEKKLQTKKKKFEDLNNAKKWAPDEINIAGKKETRKQKKQRVKDLYKEKINLLTLRKSKYPNRPQVYFCFYPERIINLYKEEGRDIVEQSKEFKKMLEVEDHDHPYEANMGITLRVPPTSEFLKLNPKEFLKRYSVPLVKIGKVYKSIRTLMKLNGLVLSKSQGYSFCWGFSKHRDQVKVSWQVLILSL